MLNVTLKFFAKRAAAAAVLVAVAAGATASAGAATKQSETVFAPKAMQGCTTDNGYGRFSSCN